MDGDSIVFLFYFFLFERVSLGTIGGTRVTVETYPLRSDYHLRNSPGCEKVIVVVPEFDVDHRHVQGMVLQSEELAASGSVHVVLDGFVRHPGEIAQEVATSPPGFPCFLPARDIRSNVYLSITPASLRKRSATFGKYSAHPFVSDPLIDDYLLIRSPRYKKKEKEKEIRCTIEIQR